MLIDTVSSRHCAQDTMEGIWLENNTLSKRADLAIPQIGAGDALVKVRLAGICGIEKHIPETAAGQPLSHGRR